MKNYQGIFESSGTVNGIQYDNFVQHAYLTNSLEESGLWDVITEIAQIEEVQRDTAFEMLKNELDYILAHDDIYLIYSEKLYDTATSKVLDKRYLLCLTLEDVEFKESGPFYYFSSVPEI